MEEEEKEPDLGGRPPHYETAKDMQARIDDYFENCPDKKVYVIGKAEDKKTVEVPILTITGLALHLGFESRQSFYDYEKKDGFTYTVKKARSFIEKEYEMQLQANNVAGAIFALKNMGWIDSKDITSKGQHIMAEPVSDEEIARAKKGLEDEI